MRAALSTTANFPSIHNIVNVVLDTMHTLHLQPIAESKLKTLAVSFTRRSHTLIQKNLCRVRESTK